MNIEHEVPFGERTTFRVGGTASSWVELDDPSSLRSLAENGGLRAPIYVLGRGSNTLVADSGFSGTVVHLGPGFAGIEVDDRSFQLRVGGAADLPVIARRSVEAGLQGFEWAVGVPGSLGGAIRMNAGGHGSEMAATTLEVSVVDLTTGVTRTATHDDLMFSYRSSSIAPTDLVVEALLQLSPGDPAEGRERLKEIVRWRREHQPGGANCGSVFTNPLGDSAGRLIDAAGLKGYRIGTAEVSEKHANFIQADSGGRGDDVAAVISSVVDQVEARSGIRLVSAVKMVGFDGAT